jgi:hypothetical protein
MTEQKLLLLLSQLRDTVCGEVWLATGAAAIMLLLLLVLSPSILQLGADDDCGRAGVGEASIGDRRFHEGPHSLGGASIGL